MVYRRVVAEGKFEIIGDNPENFEIVPDPPTKLTVGDKVALDHEEGTFTIYRELDGKGGIE